MKGDAVAAPPRVAEERLPSGHERTHYVHPGSYFAATGSYRINTVLGSCVAVCLWSGRRRIGGMNHFLMPQRVGVAHGAKFGGPAMRLLLARMEALGCEPVELQAKLFGGASMIGAPRERDVTLGRKNVELARGLLREARIPIVAEDVEGARGRKLAFFTDDGSAWVKLL
jgi:chemotaxis protein CheD